MFKLKFYNYLKRIAQIILGIIIMWFGYFLFNMGIEAGNDAVGIEFIIGGICMFGGFFIALIPE